MKKYFNKAVLYEQWRISKWFIIMWFLFVFSALWSNISILNYVKNKIIDPNLDLRVSFINGDTYLVFIFGFVLIQVFLAFGFNKNINTTFIISKPITKPQMFLTKLFVIVSSYFVATLGAILLHFLFTIPYIEVIKSITPNYYSYVLYNGLLSLSHVTLLSCFFMFLQTLYGNSKFAVIASVGIPLYLPALMGTLKVVLSEKLKYTRIFLEYISTILDGTSYYRIKNFNDYSKVRVSLWDIITPTAYGKSYNYNAIKYTMIFIIAAAILSATLVKLITTAARNMRLENAQNLFVYKKVGVVTKAALAFPFALVAPYAVIYVIFMIFEGIGIYFFSSFGNGESSIFALMLNVIGLLLIVPIYKLLGKLIKRFDL